MLQIMDNNGLKSVMLWASVLAGLVLCVYGLSKIAQNTPANPAAVLASAVSSSDWMHGDSGARVTLVEYGDFQCPACGVYFPLVKKLREDFSGRVAFVFRNFPLSQHAHAQDAARAAGAAGKQGKFFEMHDMLYQTQQDWAAETSAQEVFAGYAKALGLDVEQFKKDINSAEVADKIQNDIESGKNSGVDGTPTFFINGAKIENPRSYDAFKQLIERALAQNS